MLPDLIGRAVCASDPGHGLPGISHALPLCARCAGMHLAVAAGWIAFRRRAEPAPLRGAIGPLSLSALLVAPMAVDVALASAGLWGGDNRVRIATGLLGGLGIALALRTGEAVGTSAGAIRVPRLSAAALLGGAVATLLLLLVPILGPPAAGTWLLGAAPVASASLAVFVALQAVTGGAGGLPMRAASLAVALAALLAAGRFR